MDLDYQTLHESKSLTYIGAFGIRVEVAATKLPDLDTKAIRIATDKATKLISDEIQAAIKANDSKTPSEISKNKMLTDLFPDPIFIEEIPNGYCSDWCCRHLPWFVVTTKVGRIKIGWRKSVISIDWSETRNTKTSDELFKDEEVTMGERYIHAYGIKNAERYVNCILENINPNRPQ